MTVEIQKSLVGSAMVPCACVEPFDVHGSGARNLSKGLYFAKWKSETLNSKELEVPQDYDVPHTC